MPNLLTSLFRRAPAEISRISLSEYVRQRVAAIEDGFAFTYEPYATRGKVEKAEDSYASLASYAYRGDSVVAACMRVRRDLFRQAKFCWREVDDAGPGKIFRTDELTLLDKPWPNGTTGELLARMITDVDLCGNSFILNEGDRLRWLRPDWVQIILSGDPQVDAEVDVLGYVYTPGGDTGNGEKTTGVPYKPDEICHWSPEQDPLAFYRGMSWVSKALQEIRGDRAATDHKLAFFRNGATLGPIVRAPQGMTVAQFKEFVAAAEEAHAGAANAYKTMYLGGGAEVTLAAADFRQLDLKSVQGGMETRIAAVAGVHPTLVGLSEGLSGSSLNEGNFKAARRMTAEMTLFALWQDGCGALQAFFDVPKDAELWIRERDIPFLRDEARDRADIFKTQVLAIEAAMRAGFKPDPAVQATMEERLDVLIGEHTGLFSVQMQAPQTGMPGAEPGAPPGEPGVPAEPPPPTDFGALRADLWDVDEDDIERAVADMFDDLDEIERFDPDQARIPGGHSGGGRWGSLITQLLTAWAKGDGPDDPLGEHGLKRDQLQKKIASLRKQAADAGDTARVARLTPPRARAGESDAVVEDRLKAILYKDVGAHVRAGRDADRPMAKFTLQGKDHRDLDVAVRRLPGDKPGLFEETDKGKQGRLVEKFDSLEAMQAWAEDNGEPRLAEWARKEGGAPSKAAPTGTGGSRIMVGDLAAGLGFGVSSDPSIKNRDERMLSVVQSALDGNPEPVLGIHRPAQGTPAAIGRGLAQWANGSSGPFYSSATISGVNQGRMTPELTAESERLREQGQRWVALAEKLQATRRTSVRKAAVPSTAPKPPRMVNIADNDWDLDELEHDSGLAGKTAAELKDIADAANITLPPAVNTASKRRLFMLESAMERAERTHVGAAYDGVANLRQIVDGRDARASHAADGLGKFVTGQGAADLPKVKFVGEPWNGGQIEGLPGVTDRRAKRISDAFAGYQTEDFAPINETLRGDDRDAIEARHGAGAVARAESRIALMDSAFDQSALGRGAVLHRGTGTGEDALGPSATWGEDLTGRTWTEPAYSSTSASSDIASRFVRDGGVRLRVTAPAGTPAVRISSGPDDTDLEVVLARGLQYRVTRDNGWKTVTQATTGNRIRVRDLDVDVEVVPAAAPRKATTPAATPELASLDSLRNLNDAEAIRDELDLRKGDELKPLLREAGLPVSGRKRDLVDRLTTHLAGGGTSAPEAPTERSLADVAAAIRLTGNEEAIHAELEDVRATDVRALADELNLTLPPAAKSATARKRYIAQTMAAHHRRTGGRFEHVGPLGRTTAEENRVITDALEEGRDAREALREFRATPKAAPSGAVSRESLDIPAAPGGKGDRYSLTVDGDEVGHAKVGPGTNGATEIYAIKVPSDILGEGHARTLVQQIVDDADRDRQPVIVHIQGDEAIEPDKLRKLYESFGFRGEPDSSTLIRTPRAADAPVAPTPRTVADLRALARDRGITIPAGAKKAEILALLGIVARSEDFDDEDDIERAAGHDVTPGHDELHHYWTRGEGLAKWADSPEPWTTLVAHLTKHVGPEKAKVYASRWFIEVFGYAAGSDKNRVAHGHPPRGDVVGPG